MTGARARRFPQSLRPLLLAALATGLGCAAPPVYEKLGGTEQDFHASKQICLEYASQPQVFPECQAGGEARACRVRADWQGFDECMRNLGWERVE